MSLWQAVHGASSVGVVGWLCTLTPDSEPRTCFSS
jgi:hypothetical protein